jgi:hypothetical protein
MEGRPIVREANLDQYRQHPAFAHPTGRPWWPPIPTRLTNSEEGPPPVGHGHRSELMRRLLGVLPARRKQRAIVGKIVSRGRRCAAGIDAITRQKDFASGFGPGLQGDDRSSPRIESMIRWSRSRCLPPQKPTPCENVCPVNATCTTRKAQCHDL